MQAQATRPLAFLSSVNPMANGEYTAEVEAPEIWAFAHRQGLHVRDYGQTWFVYEAKQDYLDSLD